MGRQSRWQRHRGQIGLLLVVLLLVGPVLIRPEFVVITAIGFLIIVLRATSAKADADTTDQSVWNVIPSWQYDGRHVESGGLTRQEQEQALQDIQKTAEDLANNDR